MRKKIKKFLSTILSFIMVISLVSPVTAKELDSSNTSSFATSNTGYMEITYNIQEVSKAEKSNSGSFEIKQFEKDILTQTVEGKFGGDELIVTNYQDGEITGSEIVQVSDIITKDDVVEPKNIKSANTTLGYITYYKSMITEKEERIRVYSNNTDTDFESYTIRGKETDTLAIIVGAIASVISVFVPAANVPRQIAVAIISALGGSVAGEEIGIAFSEPVAVKSFYYELTGYNPANGRYSLSYDGIERQVLTKNSDYYNEWFYEDYTPHTWKDEELATSFWNDIFLVSCPGVKSYS